MRAIEINHPALTADIKQNVVRIEIRMIHPCAMKARHQLTCSRPRRIARRGQHRQRMHMLQALHQDRGSIMQPFAPIPRCKWQRHR